MGDLLTDLELTPTTDAPPAPDELVENLSAAYDAMFLERDRRNAAQTLIRGELSSKVGVCVEMVEAGLSSQLNEADMAAAVLRGLLSESGRKLLGLNSHCQIPYHELHGQFVDPITCDHSSRRYRSMTMDEAIAEAERPRPRLDIAKLVAHLRDTYGGAAGEAFRLSQLAGQVFNDLSLERAQFEVRAGKVELQVHVYGTRSPGDSYDTSTLSEIMRFAEVVSLLVGEQSPYEAAVLIGNVRAQKDHIGPGMKVEVGKEACVKTFKEHYRVVMTQGMAERVRAFIAEHKA